MANRERYMLQHEAGGAWMTWHGYTRKPTRKAAVAEARFYTAGDDVAMPEKWRVIDEDKDNAVLFEFSANRDAKKPPRRVRHSEIAAAAARAEQPRREMCDDDLRRARASAFSRPIGFDVAHLVFNHEGYELDLDNQHGRERLEQNICHRFFDMFGEEFPYRAAQIVAKHAAGVLVEARKKAVPA